ncbi:MAG: hypothetical protein N3C63_05425 [Rhodocyclaceae bacterium]|nr:hypothetical protein [Rhodocyclaceae bacterium]
MPDPVTSAIVGSVIGSVIEGILAPAPQLPPPGIQRLLPAESRYGVMYPPDLALWTVQIGKTVYPLSPGVQVRNEFNFTILPSMVQHPTKVRYQLGFSGAVERIWILSPLEASLPENR